MRDRSRSALSAAADGAVLGVGVVSFGLLIIWWIVLAYNFTRVLNILGVKPLMAAMRA